MIFNRIRELRIDKNLKQKDLAKVCHVEQHTYSRYETGDINIPIEAFIELARFHNTSIDYLVELVDKK